MGPTKTLGARRSLAHPGPWIPHLGGPQAGSCPYLRNLGSQASRSFRGDEGGPASIQERPKTTVPMYRAICGGPAKRHRAELASLLRNLSSSSSCTSDDERGFTSSPFNHSRSSEFLWACPASFSFPVELSLHRVNGHLIGWKDGRKKCQGWDTRGERQA